MNVVNARSMMISFSTCFLCLAFAISSFISSCWCIRVNKFTSNGEVGIFNRAKQSTWSDDSGGLAFYRRVFRFFRLFRSPFTIRDSLTPIVLQYR